MSKRVRYDAFRAVPRAARLSYTPRQRGRLVGQMVSFRRNRVPRVKGAIANRQELKFVDTALSTIAADTTGFVQPLNLLAVGDDNTTRDGREVTIKSVAIQGMLTPVDAETNANYARVMLVWDNANNSGSIATIAQILASSSSIAFPLVDNNQRFTILSDQ